MARWGSLPDCATHRHGRSRPPRRHRRDEQLLERHRCLARDRTRPAGWRPSVGPPAGRRRCPGRAARRRGHRAAGPARGGLLRRRRLLGPAGARRPGARAATGWSAVLGVSPSLAADERAGRARGGRGTSGSRSSRSRPTRATGRRTAPTARTAASTARTSCSPGSTTRSSPGHGLDAIAYGENADDARRPDRPGARAATEHGVLRPLADAGLTKADVRAIARALGPAVRRQAGRALPGLADPALRGGHPGEAAPDRGRGVGPARPRLRRLPGPPPRRRRPDRAARRAISPGRSPRTAAQRGRSGRPGARASGSSRSTSPGCSPARSPCRWCGPPWLSGRGRPGLDRRWPASPTSTSTGRAPRLPGGGLLRGQDRRPGRARSPPPCASARGADPVHPGRAPSTSTAVLAELPGRRATTPTARLVAWPPTPPEPTGGLVVVARRRAPRTCRSPARRCSPRRYLGRRAELVVDVGVAGLHRILGRLDLLRSARGDRRGRRHGRRAAQRGRRAGRARRWSRCPPRWATARRSRGWPPCSPCSTPAPRASPWSTSTTATAPATSPPRSPPAR